MVRLARQVGLGELRPEAGRLDELRRGDVVGMGIDPVRREQPPRPLLANHAGQLRAVFERGFQRAVRQAQVLAPVEAEDRRGGGRFACADFRRAVRRRLAAGEVEHADAAALLLELQNRPGHAELGVVGVRGDDEDVEHGEEAGGWGQGARKR